MEGDRRGHEGLRVSKISTHALTWRATDSLPDIVDAITISTHALTWRATALIARLLK